MSNISFQQIGTALHGQGKKKPYIRLFLDKQAFDRVLPHDCLDQIFLFEKDGQFIVMAPVK